MKKTDFSSKLLAFALCVVLAAGLIPATGFALDSMPNAPLSMALVIDNSFAAYEYNTIGDNSWLDAYAGLMEQAPEGSEFAIVTPDGTASLTGLDAAQEALYNLPLFTSTEASAASLLAAAAQALSGGSGQKSLVFSSASCYNNSELQSQIGTLTSQGVDVRIVAFEKDAQRIAAVEAAYENVVVCRDVRELPILLGDWYAEFAELPATPVMQPNSAVTNSSGKTYRSSFRTNKHEYNFLTSQMVGDMTPQQKQGIALSELLNIYYFLPSWATGGSGGYQIADGTTCQWIGKGNLYNAFQTFSDAQSLIDFWGGQAEQLLQADGYTLSSEQGLTTAMRSVIAENIKRRMPVLACLDSDIYLIIAYTESNGTGSYELYSLDGSRPVTNMQLYSDIKIVDTGLYFNLLRSGMYISDEQSSSVNTKTVTISLPDGYTDNSVQSYKKTGNDYEAMAYTSFANGAVSYQAGQDAEFVVSVRVAFDGITPNCYNATRNYIIKIYPDVSDGQWYASYVFDMSNKGYLVGSEGEDGVIRFLPDDDITLGEFLTVIYRAAEIAAKIENAETGEIVDVVPYEKTMADHALQEQWISNEQHTELVYELPPDQHQGRAITREEAADILWKAFRSDECRVPHQLYEYDLNTEYRQTAWEAYTDKNFSNTGYGESFHQLFLNGVLAGSDAQTLDPRGNLTRAQACKIVSKALYSLAEIGTTLDPIWDKSDIEELTVGETKSGELSDYGGKNYWFNADKAGYYMVSTSADKYALYDAGGIRMEPVDEKDGKDVYMVTSAQEMRLYTAGVSGAGVTTTVEHAPNGYIAPQEVVFEQPKTAWIDIYGDGNYTELPSYLIFDDHPEHVRPCDIMDDQNYGTLQGTMLSMFEDLGPGVYKVFAAHGANQGNGYLTFDFDRIKEDTYFDAVFYGSTVNNNVIIKQMWMDTQYGWNSGEALNNYSFTDLNGSNPKWASDIVWERLGKEGVELCYGDQWGGADLMMEFIVTEGSVNFATCAYHNKPSNETFNQWKADGALRAPYETLETIKGIAETSGTITANLEYFIDDSIPLGEETRLPFTITNAFFDNRKLDHFTTHNTSLSSRNRWSMVGSSTVQHTYKGAGIIGRNAKSGHPNGEPIYSPRGDNTWIFDVYHCVDIRGKAIPQAARSIFGGRENFEPNEEFTSESLKAMVGKEEDNTDDKYLLLYNEVGYNERQNMFTQMEQSEEYEWNEESQTLQIKRWQDNPSVNPGYGIINEYNITIHNLGNETRWLSFLFEGNRYGINWMKNGVWQGYKDIDQKAYHEDLGGPNEIKSDFVEYVPDGDYYVSVASQEVFRTEIPPGDTTITIWVEIYNGSNPTAHQVLALDVPRNMTTDKEQEKGYTLYNNTLHNIWDTITFEQN